MLKTIDKFNLKYTIDLNGCWIWQGYKDREGYPKIHSTELKKQVSAHRFIYEYVNNVSLDNKTFVCHSCDEPACVNPKHLFEGSHYDNMQDMVNKGRGFPGRSDWAFIKKGQS